MNLTFFNRTLILYFFSISFFCSSIQANSDNWQFTVSPYLYLPNMKAEISTPLTRTTTLTRPFSEVYKSLDEAYFLQFMARKNEWVNLFDIHHVNLSQKGHISTPLGTLGASGKIKYTAMTLSTGYRFEPTHKMNVNILGGFRYWSLKNKFSVYKYSESMDKNWVEPLIMLRATYHFHDQFFGLFYTDTDLFSNDKSWQIGGALNYQFHRNWIATVGYKWEYIKPNINAIDTKIRLNGIILGFSYRF